MTVTYLDGGVYFACGVLVWIAIWLLFYKCRITCPRPLLMRDRQLASMAEARMRIDDRRRRYREQHCLFPHTLPEQFYTGFDPEGRFYCNTTIYPPVAPPTYEECLKMDRDREQRQAQAQDQQGQLQPAPVVITVNDDDLDISINTNTDTATPPVAQV